MFHKIEIFLLAIGLLVLLPVGLASAQYTSPSYKVNEYFFGAGGELSDLSASYQARVAAGELGIDHSTSSNYQTYSGFNTTDRPILEVAVTGGTFDFGTLTTTSTKAITAVFTARSYLASGYIVELGGTPPKNNGSSYTLCNMSSAGCASTTSAQGTEQFGVNLVANNIAGGGNPGAFGADPAQVPDATFGFGAALSGYGTTNSFKYVENQNVAQSTKSSGVTQYTLSAIANIKKTTPGGTYGTSIFVNVVPTF